MQNTYQMIIRMAVRSPLMIFAVAAFAIDICSSLIFPRSSRSSRWAFYFHHDGRTRIFERVFRTYDWLNGIVQENPHGIRVVKSLKAPSL